MQKGYKNPGQTPFSLGDLKVSPREARRMNRRYYNLGFLGINKHHGVCSECGRRMCQGNCDRKKRR